MVGVDAARCECAAEYYTMRDPKGQEFGTDVDAAVGTRGVVQGNRAAFNLHPAVGQWALARRHFDEGMTISLAQNAAFGRFVLAVKAAKRVTNEGTTRGRYPSCGRPASNRPRRESLQFRRKKSVPFVL